MKISLLSLFSILVSLCIILNINCNINGVNAALSISRDRSDYIRKQLAIRNQALDDQLTAFSKNVNQVFEDKYGGLFFGLSTSMNTLSGLFGMLNLAIPCGGAAILSSAVLGVAQNAVAGSGGDIGTTIANGVKAIVDESLAGYNTATLAAKLNSEKIVLDEFYTDKIYLGGDVFKYADDVHTMFYTNIGDFKVPGYELASIGLFTLHANSHLLFLHDIVVNGATLYNIKNTTNFVKNFNQYLESYSNYIDTVNKEGKKRLDDRIKSQGIKNQDEWNLRNDYYNFMKLYVYDISNYWVYLDPINFPKGMFIENAHVSLSKLFGAPYKGNNHMSSGEIQAFLDSKNPYQYQGQFKGFYYKNYACDSYQGSQPENVYCLTKYFGGRQYFFREGVERDTFYLGDEGSRAGPRLYADFSKVRMDSANQFLCREDNPSLTRDYFWGLGVTNSSAQFNVGNVLRYKTGTRLEYPEKTVALALPISYNECSPNCVSNNYGQNKVLLVESAVLGFVNKDVKDTNQVIELTGTMIDAQKYFSVVSLSGLYYSRDGYKEYKHSISIPANTEITYKVGYKPYNKKEGYFRLYLDFKTTGATSVEVFTSSSILEGLTRIATQIRLTADSGKLFYITDIKLTPSIVADNYITLRFSKRVSLSHLSFYSIE